MPRFGTSLLPRTHFFVGLDYCVGMDHLVLPPRRANPKKRANPNTSFLFACEMPRTSRSVDRRNLEIHHVATVGDGCADGWGTHTEATWWGSAAADL